MLRVTRPYLAKDPRPYRCFKVLENKIKIGEKKACLKGMYSTIFEENKYKKKLPTYPT